MLSYQYRARNALVWKSSLHRARIWFSTNVGGYNFGSSKYALSFGDLPQANPLELRQSALKYLDSFSSQQWYQDPICSIVKGKKLTNEETDIITATKNALGVENGLQQYSTSSQIQELKQHISTYQSPYTDLRSQLRRIEKSLLTDYAGLLIGNQCMDFQKQDGVTELEESVMANAIEQRLNDALLQDEQDGKIVINRKPIYVSCVSNFTNFLDLFRKTIRSLELGIPCIILSRSHTVQHSFRWTQLLVQLLNNEDIDTGMLTYLSCQLKDIQDITQSCATHTGMLYSTCSRELAASIKSGYESTITSTGGPNTLLATEWTKEVQCAISQSATIENAGQCTALRHAIVPPDVTSQHIQTMFDNHVETASNAQECLQRQTFASLLNHHSKGLEEKESLARNGYEKHPRKNVYFKINEDISTNDDDDKSTIMDEYWRRVVVDVTKFGPSTLEDLVKWLNHHQPISLAINTTSASPEIGKYLFENTSLVVYTISNTINNEPSPPPAMTCQARPQDGEIFGEFPPRNSMNMYTKYPVMVPSSNPSYDSFYTDQYLSSLSIKNLEMQHSKTVEKLLELVENDRIRGYCIELLNYVWDATIQNPKQGSSLSSRTCLWGLQRPPLLHGNSKTLLRCTNDLDSLIPPLLLFYTTNARCQMELSLDPSLTTNGNVTKQIMELLSNDAIPISIENNDVLKNRLTEENKRGGIYNHVDVSAITEFPMVGQFTSLFFPLGHIKSTLAHDEEFVGYFQSSEKWLQWHNSL